MLYLSSDYLDMIHYNKDRYSSLYLRRGCQFSSTGVVRVGLVLGQTTYPTRKLISLYTVIMGGFGHLGVIVQRPPWFHIVVGIIQLVILVVIHKFLLLVMVKVVCFLVPSTFPPRNMIVGLMVVILCHLRVLIINPRAIPKNKLPLISYLLVGMINLSLLVMVVLVSVLVQPTSTPIRFILSHTAIMWGFVHLGVIAQYSPCSNLAVGIIQLVIMLVIRLVFLLVMVKVV